MSFKSASKSTAHWRGPALTTLQRVRTRQMSQTCVPGTAIYLSNTPAESNKSMQLPLDKQKKRDS